MSADKDRTIILGRISGVFGVKGWVKVWSFTEPLERLLDYPVWSLRLPGGCEKHEVDAGQRQGKGLVAHLAGCDDRELARRFVQAEIAVPEAAMPRLPEGEYYWYQLEGLRVLAQVGSDAPVLLGVLGHLFETGANDVMVVQPCEGSIDGRERMVPWVDGKVILGVDLGAGEIRVDWDPTF